MPLLSGFTIFLSLSAQESLFATPEVSLIYEVEQPLCYMRWSGIYLHLLPYASPFFKHPEKLPLLPCCYRVPSSSLSLNHSPHITPTVSLLTWLSI